MSIEIRVYPSKGYRSADPFKGTNGASGYLKEALDGGPYPSSVLVPEAFAGSVSLPVVVLRARLPETIRLAEIRARKVYGLRKAQDIWKFYHEYIALVEFCEIKEMWTGKPATIEITE